MDIPISKNTVTLKCFFQGLEEVIGPEELSKVSFSTVKKSRASEDFFQSVLPLQKNLQEVYGKEGFRGLAVCSGRAAFKHLLLEQGKELGFEDEFFLFLPARIKLERGLNSLSGWLKQELGISLTIAKQKKTWECRMNNESGEKPIEGVCDFLAGLLQEFMAWAGGGRFYQVRETECRSRGADSCIFLIDRFPLD